MQNLTASLSAPQEIQSNTGFVKFVRFFRNELLKILIFLMVFFACVFYANSQSKIYYSSNKSIIDKTPAR